MDKFLYTNDTNNKHNKMFSKMFSNKKEKEKENAVKLLVDIARERNNAIKL